MSILNKLTEGIVNRDLSREGAAVLSKWEKTGLLEGLDDYNQNTMAVLLENQAKELLRESNSMAGGDVEGFAAVAFPIVRRVFGGLLAQKLVSVQPMSLPSGLIFFMDFVKQSPGGASGSDVVDGALRGELEFDSNGTIAGSAGSNEPSVYGQQIRGRQVLTTGANLDPEGRADANNPTPQFQDLVQGFSHARAASLTGANEPVVSRVVNLAALDDPARKALQFDPDLLARSTGTVYVLRVPMTSLANAPHANHQLNNAAGAGAQLIGPDLRHITLSGPAGAALAATDFTDNGGAELTVVPMLVRRLTRSLDTTADVAQAVADEGGAGAQIGDIMLHLMTVDTAPIAGFAVGDTIADRFHVEFAISDNLVEATGATAANTDTLGALVGQSAWEMEGSVDLPEIAIKVDSVAVTAVTRKLKASWTPELAQDLNAYHNLDAEVELTGILSEQIALEIDQEILADLISGAKAGTLYWSRRPGLFVNRLTGADATSLAAPPDFTGSVSEWYETLVETINDVSADIHRKTLRGGANFLVCGPEVANILEFTSGFRASVTADDDQGSVGAVNVGSISKKWDLYVDPYFPRNVILVGRKGSSFLESGYVYAPYVPLQTTPTIFHAEDFTPRKAVMTRYGKKMVRPDMYGLVVVRDLEG